MSTKKNEKIQLAIKNYIFTNSMANALSKIFIYKKDNVNHDNN